MIYWQLLNWHYLYVRKFNYNKQNKSWIWDQHKVAQRKWHWFFPQSIWQHSSPKRVFFFFFLGSEILHLIKQQSNLSCKQETLSSLFRLTWSQEKTELYNSAANPAVFLLFLPLPALIYDLAGISFLIHSSLFSWSVPPPFFLAPASLEKWFQQPALKVPNG